MNKGRQGGARALIGRTAFATTLVCEVFVLGTMPIGNWAPIGLMIPVSAIGAFIMLALFASVAVSKPTPMAETIPARYRDEDSNLEDLREAV